MVAAQIRGLRLLATVPLGSGMAGGEGLAMHVGPGGRRTLYVASEHAPGDFVALDVTDPAKAEVAYRHELPGPHVRSNNLAVYENLLAVTRQNKEKGGTPAGVEFFDISVPDAPRPIGFFDASGGRSVGTHFVWLAADGYAYLANQMPEYAPRDARDRFMLSILDVSDPSAAEEVGRWWLPGIDEKDDAPARLRPAERLAAARGVTLSDEQRAARRVEFGDASSWDFGFRVHNVTVHPEQPDRAYLAYTSAGACILDIADRSRPAVVGALEYASPLPGAAHTFVPLGTSGFAILSDETLEEGAADFPQGVWIVDARIESRPLIVDHLDLPWPDGPVPDVGRFGAHNLHEYPPGQGALRSFDLVAGAFFGLGIALYDMSSPMRPREVARFCPGPDGDGPGSGQLNDVFVDDRSIVYAVDRRSDLCFILEREGA